MSAEFGSSFTELGRHCPTFGHVWPNSTKVRRPTKWSHTAARSHNFRGAEHRAAEILRGARGSVPTKGALTLLGISPAFDSIPISTRIVDNNNRRTNLA